MRQTRDMKKPIEILVRIEPLTPNGFKQEDAEKVQKILTERAGRIINQTVNRIFRTKFPIWKSVK